MIESKRTNNSLFIQHGFYLLHSIGARSTTYHSANSDLYPLLQREGTTSNFTKQSEYTVHPTVDTLISITGRVTDDSRVYH